MDEGGPLDGNYDVGAELSYYLSIRGKTTQMQFILSLFNIEINLIGGICMCQENITFFNTILIRSSIILFHRNKTDRRILSNRNDDVNK